MELAYNRESVGRTLASSLGKGYSPPVREKKLAPVEQPEWKPPPGERNRKLLDEGCISLAREERLQELWVTRLKLELKDIGAPVLVQGSLDPDRAANLLVGEDPVQHAKEVPYLLTSSGGYGSERPSYDCHQEGLQTLWTSC